MTDNSSKLQRLLGQFDSRADAFSRIEFWQALIAQKKESPRRGHDIESSLYAELIGIRDRHEDDPSPETFEYWRSRLDQVQHSFFKKHYANLIWTFSGLVTGKGAGLQVAHTLIDAAVELANNTEQRDPLGVIDALRKALRVAISISDVDRVSSVADAMIEYEEREGVDSKPGLWGFSMDRLVGNKSVNLRQEQEATIVDGLENRLTRLMDQESESFDPFHVEAAALALAEFYRSRNQPDEVSRVLDIYAAAHKLACEHAPGLVAAGRLVEVRENLQRYDMTSEADSLEPLIRDAGQRARSEMKSISMGFELDKEKLEKFLTAITEGGISKSLTRIAVRFIPDQERMVDRMRRTSDEFILHHLVTTQIMDHEGWPVGQMGTIEEDPGGHVLRETIQHIQLQNGLLDLALQRVDSDHTLNAQEVLLFLKASPAFPEASWPILEAGLGSYFQQNYLSACCVLIPQIEAAVRCLVSLCGEPIRKRSRGGAYLLKPLGELLSAESVNRILGKNARRYLQIVLTEPAGWNLRNSVCHGSFAYESIDRQAANRIVHMLLILGLCRRNEETGTS